MVTYQIVVMSTHLKNMVIVWINKCKIIIKAMKILEQTQDVQRQILANLYV